MADSSGAKLVFRLAGIGFVLALADLVEIKETTIGWLDRSQKNVALDILGIIPHRGQPINVCDLGPRLGLARSRLDDHLTLLVLNGVGGPWGVEVDGVEGIYPAAEFVICPAPLWALEGERRIFEQLALWHGEPLVCCTAAGLEPPSCLP